MGVYNLACSRTGMEASRRKWPPSDESFRRTGFFQRPDVVKQDSRPPPRAAPLSDNCHQSQAPKPS
eukprot:1880650-Amphidinium_carterae.1